MPETSWADVAVLAIICSTILAYKWITRKRS